MILEGIASAGTVPLSMKVELSNDSDGGVWVVIGVRVESWTTAPSSFEVVLKAVEVDGYPSRCVYDYLCVPKS